MTTTKPDAPVEERHIALDRQLWANRFNGPGIRERIIANYERDRTADLEQQLERTHAQSVANATAHAESEKRLADAQRALLSCADENYTMAEGQHMLDQIALARAATKVTP